LHYAASRGQLEIVKLLVKSGVVLNVNDIRRQNELHFAFMGNTNKDMITFLLEAGSRISLDRYESSVLGAAVQNNQLEILQLLHRKENFQSAYRYLPHLHFMLFCKHVLIIIHK
jgi:ankyrin repeat protein